MWITNCRPKTSKPEIGHGGSTQTDHSLPYSAYYEALVYLKGEKALQPPL